MKQVSCCSPWVPDEQPLYEVLRLGGDPREEVRGEVQGAPRDVAERLLLRLPTERGVAAQQDVCQDAQAPTTREKEDMLIHTEI